MSIRSLNGLGGETNVYLNRDPIQATEPVLATQPTVNDPITISLKGLSGYGGAGKVVRINSGNDGLEYGDDVNTQEWILSNTQLYPNLTSTHVVIGTTLNPDNRELYVNGDIELLSKIYFNNSNIFIENSSGYLHYNTLYKVGAVGGQHTFNVENSSGTQQNIATIGTRGLSLSGKTAINSGHNEIVCYTGSGSNQFTITNAGSSGGSPYVEFAGVKESGTGTSDYYYKWTMDGTEYMRLSTNGLTGALLEWRAVKIGEVYGGTNQSSYTTGDILYSDATNSLEKLAIGATGKVLKVSSGGIPEWGDASVDLTTAFNFGTASSSNISLGNNAGTSASVGIKLYGNDFKLYNTSNVNVATFTPQSNSCNLTLNGGELTTTTLSTNVQFLSNIPVGIAYGGTGLSGFGITDALKYLQVNSGGTGFQLATLTAVAEWTLNSTNLYPNSTSTNVVIGTTTNSNNKSLFVNGASEINSDLDVNGTTTSTHFVGDSGSSYLKGIITNPSTSTYPYIAYGSIEQAYIRNATIANQIIIENHTGTYRNIYITCDPNDDRLQVKGDLETGYGASNTPYVGLGNTGSYGTIYNPSGTNGGNSIAGSHINYHDNGTFMGFNLPNTTYASGSGQNFNWYSGNSKRLQLNGSTSPSMKLFLTTGTSAYLNIGQGSSFPANFSYWSNLTIPIGTAMYMGGNQTNDAEGYLLAMNGNTMMISNPGDDYSLKYYDEDGGSLGWTISATGSLASGSDSRIKRDITTYKNSNFEKFKQIRTITYKQKIPENIRPFRLQKQSCIDKYNNINYGIVAQEIFKIYPELEDTDDIRKREKFYYRKNNWDNGVYEKEHKEWEAEKEKFEKEKEGDEGEEYKTPEPQLEFNEEEPMRSFTYKNLSILTIGVVQDLIKENETLKEIVNTLKETVDKLNKSTSFKEFKSK